MATAKFTIAQGQNPDAVVVAAGSAIAGGNAMELNIDTTAMSQGEALVMIERLKMRVSRAWPPA
jgi:hypothetical protein